MINTTGLKREDAPLESTWNRESVYPTWKEWEADLKIALEKLPQLSEYNGRLKEGPGVLADWLIEVVVSSICADTPHTQQS